MLPMDESVLENLARYFEDNLKGETMEPVEHFVDQFGVVWFSGGITGAMSGECYEALRLKFPENELPPINELPTRDAYEQNLVLID
jgi:hypothetical protein